ncbi:MAG: hypothetical protein EGQ00_16825 [Parabacteroides johnsonii]|nr:hypothetical protein [Parabacteroides johnsonii]
MLGLRTQRITFGCPAGNIAGGYGINYGKIATDQMFMIILSRTSTLVDRSDRTLQSEIAARDERTLNRHQHSRRRDTGHKQIDIRGYHLERGIWLEIQ